MYSASMVEIAVISRKFKPAEVLGLVDIPSHIQFWGIDSGLQHSIRGADYGLVRIVAFMGGKMIKSTAYDISSQYYSNGNRNNLDELEEFEAIYSFNLRDTLSGEAFLTKYDHHNDPVKVIDKKRSYRVKASTRHPIYENFHVKAFKALLTSISLEEQPTALGELMYQATFKTVGNVPSELTTLSNMPVSEESVPDFSGGTMENYGLITYCEVELLHDDLHSAAENTQRLSIAVTHEVGQQWFGTWVLSVLKRISDEECLLLGLDPKYARD
ncbi:L-arabinokinase-like protein [Tanacetum coccineum]